MKLRYYEAFGVYQLMDGDKTVCILENMPAPIEIDFDSVAFNKMQCDMIFKYNIDFAEMGLKRWLNECEVV